MHTLTNCRIDIMVSDRSTIVLCPPILRSRRTIASDHFTIDNTAMPNRNATGRQLSSPEWPQQHVHVEHWKEVGTSILASNRR